VNQENPLVAGEADRPLSTEGAGAVDSAVRWASSAEDLANDMTLDNWLDMGISSGVLALDAVATYSDPIGSLFSAGIGFVLEHLSPLNEWFDELAGDPEEVAAFAQTWRNVQIEVGLVRTHFGDASRVRLEEMTGDGVAAYRARSEDLKDKLAAIYASAGGTAASFDTLGQLVDVTHDLVRDALSDVIGSLISYALELALTLGAATPLVIQQASTRVASLAATVGTQVRALVRSAGNLQDLVRGLRQIIDDIPRWARSGATPIPIAGSGRHSPQTADEAIDLYFDGWRRELPDVLRGVGVKTGADVVREGGETQ
jgi:hypothetical protein